MGAQAVLDEVMVKSERRIEGQAGHQRKAGRVGVREALAGVLFQDTEGFPVVVSAFLLVRPEARLAELQRVVWHLAELLAGWQEQ